MVDEIKIKLFPRTMANKVIDAQSDSDGLTDSECREMGIDRSCKDLQSVFGADGYITQDEEDRLIEKGYDWTFVNRLSALKSELSGITKVCYEMATDRWAHGPDRLEAARKLVSLGEIALGKKALQAIAMRRNVTGRSRLGAARSLVELGEIEMAKAAYRSIGLGKERAVFVERRFEAAQALLRHGERSDAIKIYYTTATDGVLESGSTRLEAAARLVEIRAVEMAVKAYLSIGSGESKAVHEEDRLAAGKALENMRIVMR